MNKQLKLWRHILASLLAAGLLAGCGSGDSAQPVGDGATSGGDTGDTGDGGTDPVTDEPGDTPNIAPVANAGVDQSALAGTTIYLPGSGEDSDGTIASYEWVQVEGTSAIINNTTAATTTVSLPLVGAAEDLTFSLTVTDNDDASHTDEVTISLFVEADQVTNAKPVADAGADVVVSTGDEVGLSGLGDDLDGVITSYVWQQSDGATVALENANTSTPSFMAPEVDGFETFTFVLTVTDDGGATAADDVNVEVFSLMVPPENVDAVATPGTITLTWDEVPGAETYNLYYAEESFEGDELANYARRAGGTLVVGIDSLSYELDSPNTITEFYFVVTAVRGSDESDGSEEVTVASEVGILVGATDLLNDTGFDTCATALEAGRLCPIDSFKEQDGDNGRDSEASEGTLEKSGSGRAGFDFFKVDAKGKPLASGAEEWDCVFDNRTGLLWEVKKSSDGLDLQSTASKFTWYINDSSINGGDPGTETGGTSCNLNGDCNTTAYIAAINAENLCGYSNWRLPTVMELTSIIDHGAVQPAVDTDFFPLAQTLLAYWTQTVYANGGDAWAVEFNTGTVGRRARSSEAYVRLVVGELPEEDQ